MVLRCLRTAFGLGRVGEGPGVPGEAANNYELFKPRPDGGESAAAPTTTASSSNRLYRIQTPSNRKKRHESRSVEAKGPEHEPQEIDTPGPICRPRPRVADMSLLQDEEFVIYQLRTNYLATIKDGVGERLINVNHSVLNNPAFRSSGWQPNPSEINRTYSPPIPTAVTAEYFQTPRHHQNSRSAAGPNHGFGDEEEESGMVTGGGSNETVGPGMNIRRRRRQEQLEQDDSSDLSEESEEENETRPVQQLKFSKMPLRNRAGSSPLRSTNLADGPSLLVTSPSRPNEASQLRRGSIGTIDGARPRRDTTATTTSSELSSDTEFDSTFFQRKPVNSRKARASQLLTDRIQEDEREGDDYNDDDDDAGEESDASLSSAFVGSADSRSILGGGNSLVDSLSAKLPGIQVSTPQRSSPRKPRLNPTLLGALPPPRPISMVAPVSLLTRALKANMKAPEIPFAKFAALSGKGEATPLYIKIYATGSRTPDKPFELLMHRTSEGSPVTVADTIGFALWRYGEEAFEPKIVGDKATVNRWNIRIAEDGEVDFDFPAITRTTAITDWTSNNNRGARARSREKPWDEFALVEATEGEFQKNEKDTPKYRKEAYTVKESAPIIVQPALLVPSAVPSQATSLAPSFMSYRNPITGPSFSSAAFRKESTPLDAPATSVSHATPRTGLSKTLNIHFTDENLVTRTTLIEVTTDTYIAEVFDQVCKRLNVDKGLYVLKVANTLTVVPQDRTVEALGDRADLDLSRRRFVGDGAFGLSGSPGSSSPNAPLLIAPGGTPKKGKQAKIAYAAGPPMSQKQDSLLLATSGGFYKRFNVIRKQPMSFSSNSARVIMLEGEFMHIMPNEGPKAVWETQGKTTTIPYSSLVGCKALRKHPKSIRVILYKERESKRYDFEAVNAEEANELVTEIRKGMDRSKPVEAGI